ncbi:MAG TPA: hypothetical protein VGO53_16240 [Steroidobacteraceae bacterium]|jgi:hypothetical protein|nr:hypothetical protein [Steroidobacteraceae bacterium]
MSLDPEIASELDRRMMAALDKQLQQARATNARLHRRCQLAEQAALQNLEACQRGGVSVGGSLAWFAARAYARQAVLARAWKQLARKQRAAGRGHDAAHDIELDKLTGHCDWALANLERANAHVTDLQTRGTELVLENRLLKDRMTEVGPRRELWVGCGGCKARARHPSEIKHRPGCTPIKTNGNGATTTTKGD